MRLFRPTVQQKLKNQIRNQQMMRNKDKWLARYWNRWATIRMQERTS